MTQIHADLGALAQTIGDFALAKAALDGTASELEARLTDWLSAWSGEARDAYDQAQRERQQAQCDMSAQLGWLHGVMLHGRFQRDTSSRVCSSCESGGGMEMVRSRGLV